MTKPTPTQNLMTMLNLTPAESVGGDDAFTAVTLTRETPRTYGGQVLAQAIMAADNTVSDKVLHSIHAYFLHPGDITKELIFTSQRLNNGRSFATRRVQALQDDIPIFSAIASFQKPSHGPEHTAVEMPQVPDPEGLPSVSDYIGEVAHPVAQAVAWERPIDIRYVSPHLYTAPDSRSQEPVATVRRHGKFWLEQGMKSASLDHAMWFHREARADEWLLYVMDSPTAQGGRMLARGSIFTREGKLVATVAQEMMFRLPEYR